MITIRCPVCRTKFRWDIESLGWPEFCPSKACDTRIAHDRDDDDVVVPFIRTTQRTESIDKVYRDIEAGSEKRANMAAEMLGVPAAEMSGLKITDMRDNQKAGDLAVPPGGHNEVSALMARNPQLTGYSNPQAVEYSSAVMSGPHANAGARMRTMIQDMHPSVVGSLEGKDESGRMVRLSGHGVTSDRPGLETQQPGYRRRG